MLSPIFYIVTCRVCRHFIFTVRETLSKSPVCLRIFLHFFNRCFHTERVIFREYLEISNLLASRDFFGNISTSCNFYLPF